MIKIAIVGAGFIGEIHANAYKEIDGAEIVAVVDKSTEKGKKLAQNINAEYYEDLDNLLEIRDIDCVDICVPTFLHHDMVLKAAARNKHIFCEKPLALTLEDAEKMVGAVKDKETKSMVGHELRFWPEYVKAKEILESGELGKPLHCFCQRLASLPDWHVDNWGSDEKLSGGAALDLHIHDLDYMLWLFGKPNLVKAQGVYNPDIIKHGGLVHIDTAIEFNNGVSGFAEGGWAFKGGFPFTMVFRILCEKGTIEWIFRAGKNIEERSQQSNIIIYKDDGSIKTLEVEQKDSFLIELTYFIDCIKNDVPVENATFEDGKNAVELALAAIKSAKEKTVIKF